MTIPVEVKKQVFLMYMVESWFLTKENKEAMIILFDKDRNLFFERAEQVFKLMPREKQIEAIKKFRTFDTNMRRLVKEKDIEKNGYNIWTNLAN